MKVLLNQSACQGHGRCYEIAPDIFTDDERGYGEVTRDEVPSDPAQARALAEAISSCPEMAISVADQGVAPVAREGQ
ncbi:ferredoxin [Nocardioides sp. cx-173]|uniref:ferredoxin n=1 Tax=Nocardioides sp. cx-173 TaxID=2898796 RepID=UPI001E59E1B0|nr:ferredoxin [Nocardioides sp. cx-173]MCD4524285.1 ferredoxin [Nocardioides sp. cx-173]UGB41677.1 ferredoxin [Nocardioides sp. cx-173]